MPSPNDLLPDVAPVWLRRFGKRRPRRRRFLFLWSMLLLVPWAFAASSAASGGWTYMYGTSRYSHDSWFLLSVARLILFGGVVGALGYWSWRSSDWWNSRDDRTLLRTARVMAIGYFASYVLTAEVFWMGLGYPPIGWAPLLLLMALMIGPRYMVTVQLRVLLVGGCAIAMFMLLHSLFGLRIWGPIRLLYFTAPMMGLIVPAYIAVTLIRDVARKRRWRKAHTPLTIDQAERLRIDYKKQGLDWLPIEELAMVSGFRERPAEWLEEFLARTSREYGLPHDEKVVTDD